MNRRDFLLATVAAPTAALGLTLQKRDHDEWPWRYWPSGRQEFPRYFVPLKGTPFAKWSGSFQLLCAREPDEVVAFFANRGWWASNWSGRQDFVEPTQVVNTVNGSHVYDGGRTDRPLRISDCEFWVNARGLCWVKAQQLREISAAEADALLRNLKGQTSMS